MTEIKPMTGKVTMVTGATGGIGKITAAALAAQGAEVVLVGRNAQKGAAVVAEIQKKTANDRVSFLRADLSLQEEVRHLAAAFKADHTRLDVLVNNAGAFFMRREETGEGFEMTFALNHLNYFLLTHLLLDVLKASAPARIVNVSSAAHRGAKLDLDDVQGQKHFGGWQAYGRSKLANVLFTYELARRLQGSGVTANALHPGFVATNFAMNNGPLVRLARPLMHLIAISPEKGAETSIYLATSTEVAGVTGKYFDKKKAVRSSSESYDETVARRLWEISESLTGLGAATREMPARPREIYAVGTV